MFHSQVKGRKVAGTQWKANSVVQARGPKQGRKNTPLKPGMGTQEPGELDGALML